MNAIKITKFALLLTLFSGFAFAQDAPCAFRAMWETVEGHDRAPAIEDVYDADFEMIFGEEPKVTPNTTVNIAELGRIETWRQFRRDFGSLIDFEIDEQVVSDLFYATQGGFPVAWQDIDGNQYVAFIGIKTPLYRLPTFWFTDPNFGFVQSKVYWQIVTRGGCIPNFPSDAQTGRNLGILSGRNDENCAAE